MCNLHFKAPTKICDCGGTLIYCITDNDGTNLFECWDCDSCGSRFDYDELKNGSDIL